MGLPDTSRIKYREVFNEVVVGWFGDASLLTAPGWLGLSKRGGAHHPPSSVNLLKPLRFKQGPQIVQRVARYSFTSPTIVRSLIEAKRGGVDVRVLVDDRGNRGQASLAALNLIVSAGIPTRVLSRYALHHDKYIIVDRRHTETGSFNFSQAAAKANSENVLVVWNNPEIALRYLSHWERRWTQGMAFEPTY